MEMKWTDLTSWLLGGVLSLIGLAILRDRLSYWRFKNRMPLQGPYAFPFVGTTLSFFFNKSIVKTFGGWWKKYGNFYAIYSPTSPGVVVSDLELVKEVMVKQFLHFPNRVTPGSTMGKPWTEILTALKDDHWKHVRGQLSPTFSTGKIKKMMPIVQQVCSELQDAVGKKAEKGEMVELKQLSGQFTMDVIAGAAFGIQVDSLHNPDEPFVKHALAFEQPSPLRMFLVFMFPRLTSVLKRFLGFQIVPKTSEDFFMQITDMALKQRRQDEQKHSDFLQLMVEAEKEGENQKKEIDQEIDHGDHLTTSKQWTRKGLTYDEMRGNAFLFLLAGYGTSSTVLSFALFYLAHLPECVKKAQAEVDEKIGKKQVDYESANNLTYLEMCINEAMRLFPPGFIINREVRSPTELGGVKMEEGWQVTIPVFTMHRNPALWPDPETFDPERHTPEARAARHPFAFLPFGQGPRNCIGMRLAQLEVRMALAAVLQKFTPVPCDKTVFPPKLFSMRMQARDGLWVKFVPRNA